MIAVIGAISLLWDGWTGKKATDSKRMPTDRVMFSRRFAASMFGIPEAVAQRAINDLIDCELITVVEKGKRSVKANRGSTYNLSWLSYRKNRPKDSRQTVQLYWGLLTSKAFKALDDTLKAVLILLHLFHSRRSNRVTIKPSSLKAYGIHRNRLLGYANDLRLAGLLDHIDGNQYRFTWINDSSGKPDFSILNA